MSAWADFVNNLWTKAARLGALAPRVTARRSSFRGRGGPSDAARATRRHSLGREAFQLVCFWNSISLATPSGVAPLLLRRRRGAARALAQFFTFAFRFPSIMQFAVGLSGEELSAAVDNGGV